ncbi:MAG TPA: response regulator transcription factor [Blastocatellia bacterium]|jgi:two-component system response regulator CpxR
MQSVLVIDDDVELCELVSEYLEAEGFHVEAVHNGERGLERALADKHALVILDVMLPGLGGFDVLRRIRAASKIPVLMLTARGHDVDRIQGLETGADDYLPKPFNPRELVARIRAILRRASPKAGESQQIEVGDIELDRSARTVRRAGEIVDLTSVEFDMLDALLRRAGSIVSREELARTVLEREFTPYDRSIDVHISNLRKKLGPRADQIERIKSVRSVGYIYTISP